METGIYALPVHAHSSVALSLAMIQHASASSLSFRDLGRCPRALERVLGEGQSCHDSSMPASLCPTPLTHGPPLIILYVLY